MNFGTISKSMQQSKFCLPPAATHKIKRSHNIHFIIFIVAPRMLMVLSLLFVQLIHTNYYKIVKQLKSFKIIIVAPTCFDLHKPSSGSSQPVLR